MEILVGGRNSLTLDLNASSVSYIQAVFSKAIQLSAVDDLSFLENQPIGTVVGEFSAIDPDTNLTSSL